MEKKNANLVFDVEAKLGPEVQKLMAKLDVYNSSKPGVIPVLLSKGAQLPRRSTEGAAGWDICTNITEPVTVEPFERVTLPTGIAVALPPGFYWDLRARSGLSFRHGLMLINGAGVIDEDYRGDIAFQYFNASGQAYTFNPGDRIGQAILTRYYEQEYEYVDELPDTKRGSGGFGSTGRD